MKTIYILDEYQSSKTNGIGIFIEELIYCFQQLNVETCLISFNFGTKEFNFIEKEDGISKMYFPPLPDRFLNSYTIIDKFFRLYITDSSENIFVLNHFPCDKFIEKIRSSYPLSKFVLVIHNQMWTSELLGNYTNLEEIIHNQKNDKVKRKHMVLVENFHIEQRMYAAADRVICLSNDTYKAITALYKKNKNVFLIKNGYRDKCPFNISQEQKLEIRMKMNLDANEKILIYVGRLSEAKGIDVLIKSFCNITKEYPKTRLLIAGLPLSIEYCNYLFNISQAAVSQISFLGQVSHAEIENWYRIADIGILPSYSEQCSFTGIEMMMHGLPIIASNGFGVKNMFVDSINAKIATISTNKGEYEINLTAAIKDLLKSESACKTLGANARKTFEVKYNIENMTKEYNNLLYFLE